MKLLRSYGNYTPALSLDRWSGNGSMNFWIHLAHQLTLAGNHSDALLRSGTNPAPLMAFTSHLKLIIFCCESPAFSSSSLCHRDFVFTSSSLTNPLSPQVPGKGLSFTPLLGKGFVTVFVTGQCPRARDGLQIWEVPSASLPIGLLLSVIWPAEISLSDSMISVQQLLPGCAGHSEP